MIQHHPGFRDISIDYSVLLQLPDDSSILPDIESASIAEDGRTGPEGFSGIDGLTATADPDDPTTAAVPDTRAHTLEVDDLRRGTYFFPYVYNHLRERITNSIPGLGIRHEGNAVPAFDWPRLDTFRYSQQGRGQRIFSLAFPSLFPYGDADWSTPRQRSKELTFYD